MRKMLNDRAQRAVDGLAEQISAEAMTRSNRTGNRYADDVETVVAELSAGRRDWQRYTLENMAMLAVEEHLSTPH